LWQKSINGLNSTKLAKGGSIMNNNRFKTRSVYQYDGLKVVLETNGQTIEDVLNAFEFVLKGSGFCFNGNITIEDSEQ
jgi:hypothetical protein